MKRLLCGLFVLVLALSVLSCSEDTKAPVVDQTVPEVKLFIPFDTEPQTFVVSDSIDTYIGAHDIGAGGNPGGISSIELFFNQPGIADPVRIGSTETTISIESVRDSVVRESIRQSLPADWSLYTRRWYTGPTPLPPIGTYVPSGTYVQIFAIAADMAGNKGRTAQPVRVVVFNKGERLRRPVALFNVLPTTGFVNSLFAFDPRDTRDNINSDHDVRVRWDFDGNPGNGWDVDWGEDARADQVIRRSFTAARTYRINMQAHNTYLPVPDSISDAPPRDIRVTPKEGVPNPPDPENYVSVPAGLYPISKADTTYVLDGDTLVVDASERPPHLADIRQPYRISKFEVTNQLYLQYLEGALAIDSPNIQYVANAIWSRDQADPTLVLYCQLEQSRIFYDLDSLRFVIKVGYADHPVTGVTWDGATAYALFYGMRLPTEAEWEVAARGTFGELNYPFEDGRELSRTDGRFRVNYLDARGSGDPFYGGTTPIGFFDGRSQGGFQTIDTPSIFGLYDMAGNVAEWVNDWFGAYPPNPPDPEDRPYVDVDPQGPVFGVFRVARGGSYTGTRVDCRATARRGYEPGEYGTSIGFRCAYNPLD